MSRTKHEFRPSGVCSRNIEFELDGDVVHNVKYLGGCDGNLKAISSLVEGMKVSEIEEKLSGIKCGFRDTSCSDQLVKGLKEALASSK